LDPRQHVGSRQLISVTLRIDALLADGVRVLVIQ
jgi:hypothetical protein